MRSTSRFEEKNKMNILRFIEEFPSEEACKDHFIIQREHEGVATSQKLKLKRRRGSQSQMNIAAMAESTPLEDIETGVKSNQGRYYKMTVLYDHKAETINSVVQENFEEKSIVFSDKSISYVDISKYVEILMPEKSDKQTNKSAIK